MFDNCIMLVMMIRSRPPRNNNLLKSITDRYFRFEQRVFIRVSCYHIVFIKAVRISILIHRNTTVCLPML